jgi:hypothetical protein
MRPFPRRLALVATLAAALLIPGSAAAFPLTNCTLELTSLDSEGLALDSATGGSADATQEDPFIVAWDGEVLWNGTMGSQVIKDNSWHVDVFGIPTPLRGGGANDEGKTDGEGTVDVSSNLPFTVSGLFFVSGDLTGEGGSCAGSGWLKLDGDPVGTVPFFLALALVVLGAVLIAVGARGGWLPALVGGLLFGIGVAMLLVGFSTLPIGSLTVAGSVVLGLLIGALSAWLGRSRRAPGLA